MTGKSSRAIPSVRNDAVLRATGKNWQQWFVLLDKAGAKERTHAEIVHILHPSRIKNGWWAQTVTVEYERARGKRARNQTASGFNVSVHRTAPMPLSRLYAEWIALVQKDPALRKMEMTTVRPRKTVRYKFGEERVVASFAENTARKSSRIGIGHEKLADAGSVERYRAFWKKKLAML